MPDRRRAVRRRRRGRRGVRTRRAVRAQDKKKDDKKKVDPKTFIPDEATMKPIAEKTEQLRKAVAALKEKKIPDDVLIEVEIYLKAAENIVRFEEWLAADSVKWALHTLDQGLERAKQAEGGKAVVARRAGQVGGAGVPLARRRLDSALRGAAPARLRQGPEEEVAARHRAARPRRRR